VLDDPRAANDARRAHFLKALLILVWFLASYVGMLAASDATFVLVAAVSAGLALAGLPFNVQHDGGHGAFSDLRRLNSAAAGMLDFVGMSSYLWRWKHNLLHHQSPNVNGRDDDIDGQPLLRLHPDQQLRPWHRYQHIYCWPLYSLLTLKWLAVSDFHEAISGRIGTFPFPPMSHLEKCRFWLSKVQFAVWALAIPVLIHGWATGLAFFLVFEMTGGFVAAVCFQLAHCAEGAAQHSEEAAASMAWDELQLSAAVDFRAPRGLAWFLGGLNHQLVHHLFPGVRHTLYSQIAGIVGDEAEKWGRRYATESSMARQIGSHYRFMRQLGRGPTDLAPASVAHAPTVRPQKPREIQ